MMSNIPVVTLLSLVVQTHAKDFVPTQNFDKWVDKLIERALEASSPHLEHLDVTALGKPSHLTTSPCKGQVYSSSGLASLQPRFPGSQSRCSTPCFAHCEEGTDSTQPLGRRELAVILGGAAAAATQPTPALADVNDDYPIQAFPFVAGPSGIQYRDLIVGDGDEAQEGASVAFNYIIEVTTKTGKRGVGKGNFFSIRASKKEAPEGVRLALTGGGKMPPMKLNGKRQVILPADVLTGASCKGNRLIPLMDTGDQYLGNTYVCVVDDTRPFEVTMDLISLRNP